MHTKRKKKERKTTNSLGFFFLKKESKLKFKNVYYEYIIMLSIVSKWSLPPSL